MSRVYNLMVTLGCATALCTSALADTNSISAVKQLGIGMTVHLTGKIVVKSLWGDRFYIVEPDRSCGIGVLSTAAVVDGQIVTIDGTKTSQNGEAYISATSPPAGSSTTTTPRPMGVSSRSFLSGASSTGLLAKVWGKVTGGMQSDALGGYFTIGDGGPDGVRVYVGNTGAQVPSGTDLVTVVGISGMSGATRVVLLGQKWDIQTPGTTGTVAPETVPEWVWGATGIARLSFNLSSVTAACADGADVVEVPVQDGWYSYYPSTVATPSPTYGNGTLLGQILGYAHSHGAKLLGTMPACKDASCLTTRTDWRQRPTDSTTWLTKPADQVTGCLVSPYGNYLIAEVKEQAQTVGLDGVSLQGYSNTQTFCYCTYCKAKYLADTGYSIPTSVNYNDANFRRYLLWHDTQIINHFTNLRAQVRAVNPNFGLFAWSSNGGEYGQYAMSPRIAPTGLNSLFDCAMQNVWCDETNQGLSVVPEFGARYLSALTHHKPCIDEASYLTHYWDVYAGVMGSSMPEAEIQYRMLSALAAGCTTSFSSTEKQYMRASLFGLARSRSQWTYKATPMKWAAMVVSEPTRLFYGRSDAVNKYMANCFGCFRAMLDYHFPIDIITETDLESGLAAGYKVLILPNTACMSAAGMSAVRAFVAGGGGLVATGAASLYDEQGVARTDYGLADIFKANKSAAGVVLSSKVSVLQALTDRNSQLLGKMLSPSGNATTYNGDVFPVTVAAGGTNMATIYTDTTFTSTYPFYINNQTAGGRVAYFPATVDSAHMKYPLPYQGVLLKDAVTWAASSQPSVTIVGPKSLQVTFFTQNNGKRLVVHLLNATNSRGAHANPTQDVPLRDEVAPLYGIEVWFESVTPTSVTLQPENVSLTTFQQGGRTRVIVDGIMQHSMVVADIP